HKTGIVSDSRRAHGMRPARVHPAGGITIDLVIAVRTKSIRCNLSRTTCAHRATQPGRMPCAPTLTPMPEAVSAPAERALPHNLEAGRFVLGAGPMSHA